LLGVQFDVVPAAKPPHLKRLRVVVMVGVNLDGTANFARLVD
jgi:hypothetical protein